MFDFVQGCLFLSFFELRNHDFPKAVKFHWFLRLSGLINFIKTVHGRGDLVKGTVCTRKNISKLRNYDISENSIWARDLINLL